MQLGTELRHKGCSRRRRHARVRGPGGEALLSQGLSIDTAASKDEKENNQIPVLPLEERRPLPSGTLVAVFESGQQCRALRPPGAPRGRLGSRTLSSITASRAASSRGGFPWSRGGPPGAERDPHVSGSQPDERGWLALLLLGVGGREDAGYGYVHDALAQFRVELPETGSKRCYRGSSSTCKREAKVFFTRICPGNPTPTTFTQRASAVHTDTAGGVCKVS